MAPRHCNELSLQLRKGSGVAAFIRQLKTHYFNIAVHSRHVSFSFRYCSVAGQHCVSVRVRNMFYDDDARPTSRLKLYWLWIVNRSTPGNTALLSPTPDISNIIRSCILSAACPQQAACSGVLLQQAAAPPPHVLSLTLFLWVGNNGPAGSIGIASSFK